MGEKFNMILMSIDLDGAENFVCAVKNCLIF